MKRFCLALDLVDDEKLIKEYETYHKNVSPYIQQTIRDAGIQRMDLYRFGSRLFMIMEVNDDFSFEEKTMADAADDKVQQWEQLMWKYQQALPGAKPGEKWVLMDKIFSLTD
ncbi:MAG: L-rhamnose mutarotase [Ferruginibacter sp.]